MPLKTDRQRREAEKIINLLIDRYGVAALTPGGDPLGGLCPSQNKFMV
jgi:hypothetical protein